MFNLRLNRNLITACEEDSPRLQQPCSAGQKKLTAEIGVPLQRPVGNYRYSKSHVEKFDRGGETFLYWSFALGLV